MKQPEQTQLRNISLGTSDEINKARELPSTDPLVLSPENSSEIRSKGGYTGDNFLISPVTSQIIESADYKDCLGVVAFGISKETGEALAIAIHANTKSFTMRDPAFAQHSMNTLLKFRDQTVPSTRRGYIFGGMVDNSKNPNTNKEIYIARTLSLHGMMQHWAGTEATLAAGPYIVAYDNSEKALHGGTHMHANPSTAHLTLVKNDKESPVYGAIPWGTFKDKILHLNIPQIPKYPFWFTHTNHGDLDQHEIEEMEAFSKWIKGNNITPPGDKKEKYSLLMKFRNELGMPRKN